MNLEGEEGPFSTRLLPQQNPVTKRRRQFDDNRTYWGRRAYSGPLSSEFGVPTHVDAKGREYNALARNAYGEITELACRVVGPKGSLRRPAGSEPAFPRSRMGGNWNPRFPTVDQDLVLFRLRDQVLCFGTVDAVWDRPQGGITARIVLKDPLECQSRPVADPSRYRSWLGMTLSSTAHRRPIRKKKKRKQRR